MHELMLNRDAFRLDTLSVVSCRVASLLFYILTVKTVVLCFFHLKWDFFPLEGLNSVSKKD